MVRVFYDAAYVGAAHAFDTTRKSKWIADSLVASPIPGIELVSPAPLLLEDICRVHDPAYVRAVETGEPRHLAQSQGFLWDSALWPMVLSSNGGVVAAAHSAMASGIAGSLSSGLHHARHGHGAGFCTFNGLVIAAQDALHTTAASVLILDLDAHCGGGTASLIAQEPRIWQVDVAVSWLDSYEKEERARLGIVEDASGYLDEIEEALAEVQGRGPPFDLCIYNAGMDPYERCSIGGLEGITREILAARERMVFEWCRERRIPIAFVLAGGYVGPDLGQEELVGLHRLTLEAAAESDRERHSVEYGPR